WRPPTPTGGPARRPWPGPARRRNDPRKRGERTPGGGAGSVDVIGRKAGRALPSPSRTRTYNKPVNSRNMPGPNPLPANTSDDGAPGVALCLAQTEETPIDPDLLRVVQAWPDLPDAIRRAVLALVSSASG